MGNHETLIMQRYESGVDRSAITEELMKEYSLEMLQAQPIVEAVLLRNKNISKKNKILGGKQC